MENEIKEFFGVQDDGKSQESEKNDLDNDGKRSVAEDIEKNVKMSADEIFGGESGSEGNTESSGDDNEKPVNEKKDEGSDDEPEPKVEDEPVTKDEPKEEPNDEPEPKTEDEPEKQKKVDETKGKSIRELMGKSDGISECDPTNGSFHNGHQIEEGKEDGSEDEEVDPDTRSLNESIQAIRQFVKANKKFFK